MQPSTRVRILALVAIADISMVSLGCGGQQPPPSQESTAAPRSAATASPSTSNATRSPASASATTSAAPVETPAEAPPPPPPPPPPRVFTLKAGSPISVYTTTAISTETHATGDTFVASLDKPIVDGDWVIAKEGARVEGTVVDSDPGGKVKGVASIGLSLRKLTLADGRSLDLNTNTVSKDAPSSKKKDVKKVGIGAGVGTAIGAIAGGGKGAAIGAAVGGGAGTAAALATRGDPASLPSETLLKFSLETSISVTEKK